MPASSNEQLPPATGATNTPANGDHGTQPKLINFDLTQQELHQGARPGDRYVRIVRPYGNLFQRVGPGYLRATEEVDEPHTGPRRAMSMLKHVLIGEPLPTHAEIGERLGKAKALAIFASDAMSSVAYATEEILFVLVLAGSAFLGLAVPISLGIALLLAIVVSSYRQIVRAYPAGGGSYVLSREKIGTTAGLVAAAALMLDYVMTVAVSVASGTAALTSALPDLFPYRVPLALMFVAVMVVGNLRGVRESGNIFAVPTYIFIFGLGVLILNGLYRIATGQPPVEQPLGGILGEDQLSTFLLLTAFSAGCVAMSGTEAIADGVQAFKPPESKNAATTLTVMAGILAFFFTGISFLSWYHGLVPSATETIVSQLGRVVFGRGPFYYLVQFATMAILILAANASFNGFPRLASIMARDDFLPHQFAVRGDRLAFSYGIIVLGALASLLIVIFEGDTHALIPLYAVGVFLAFTLSQFGIVLHWWKLRKRGWQWNLLVNGVGATLTGSVLIIAAITKFTRGAWIIVFLIPVLVWLFSEVYKHYQATAAELQLKVNGTGHQLSRIRQIVLVPLSDLNLASARALEFAHSISDKVSAIYVAESQEEAAALRDKLLRFDPELKLIVVESPYRTFLDPLLVYIKAVHEQDKEAFITVILPEVMTRHWWQRFLHNGTAERLNHALRPHPNIAVVNVPYVLHH